MAKNDIILLDGIIQQRLAEKFPSEKSDEVFEYLVIQELLKDYDLSPDEIESGWIDGNGDGGLDGFYIFVNGNLLDEEESFTWPRAGAAIDVWIITCKHHATFAQATLDAALATIQEVFDFGIEEADLDGKYSQELLMARRLLVAAYRRLSIGRPTVTIQVIYGSRGDSYLYAFEELENNLHPSLLRRLLRYIDRHVTQTGAVVFLTTHSSAALDFFGPAKNAQIIHITHDGESAKAITVAAHFDRVSVLTELGAKPSDLLQANGVLWMEGPSDRVYLNRWIELVSKDELREGKDYACAFYGGSLLARTQFAAPTSANKELTNLLRINGNVAVVCDSDRQAPGSDLKPRVMRILKEIEEIPGGHAWITSAKEIENYIPAECLEKNLGLSGITSPDQYEGFFPTETSSDSFIETKLKRKTLGKVELAEQVAPLMTLENMALRFDWLPEVVRLVETIRRWNS